MKKYDVDVEVTQRFTVTLEAENPEAATSMIEEMTPDEIDAEGHYIDTSTEVLEVSESED